MSKDFNSSFWIKPTALNECAEAVEVVSIVNQELGDNELEVTEPLDERATNTEKYAMMI